MAEKATEKDTEDETLHNDAVPGKFRRLKHWVAAREIKSAPELPHEVAKQFGLHHHDKVAAKEDAKQIAPVADSEASIVDDPKTDTAVEAILAKESDELLASQGANQLPLRTKPRGFWKKAGHFFGAWWHNKPARWATIIFIVVALGTLTALPKTRYIILNTVGVRSSASVVVLDNTTGLPLKNVSVSLGSIKSQTDVTGKAKLRDLKLGDHILTIKRIAFAPHKQEVTIGWGSNPLGEYKLTATGVQYVLHAVDFLSGKPVQGVEVISDQVNALSDKEGKIILTVDDVDVTTLTVTASSAGYRKETLSLDAARTTETTVPLVPDQKEVFVSKESGKYDVYAVDLDGKNRKLLLAGTGRETSNISLVVAPDGGQAALVSTRDDVHSSDGYLLHSLTFIDLQTGRSTTVDHAEQIQPVDWIGGRFIYRSTIASASAANTQRNRLVSYNLASNARLQLATANQFNTILSARGSLYYGASSTDPQATLGLFKIRPDGSGRERLSNQEVWSGLRTAYDVLSLQTPEGWYTYDLSAEKLAKASAPTNFVTYTISEDPGTQRAIWTDVREGKGVLLMRMHQKNKVEALATQTGLTYPLRWAGDKAIVYRVVTTGESADYVVSPSGGTPRKIVDVTATYGYMQTH